jgi:hypothetical protein
MRCRRKPTEANFVIDYLSHYYIAIKRYVVIKYFVVIECLIVILSAVEGSKAKKVPSTALLTKLT